jgi:hypothetical protein
MLNLILSKTLAGMGPCSQAGCVTQAISDAGFNKVMESSDLNRPLVVKMFLISAYSRSIVKHI